MTTMHYHNDRMQERIIELDDDLKRHQSEIKRLRDVMRCVFEPGSEHECKLCWEKKEALRQGVYPGTNTESEER